MKSIAISWLSILWITSTLAQTVGRPLPEGLMLAVKGVLEKQLSGTPIRGRTDSFLVRKDPLSGLYTFSSDVNALLPPLTIGQLENGLNGLLAEQTDEGLMGEVFFDTHLDSAVVHVWPAAKNGTFFSSAFWIPRPSDGMASFSKRLHDYLRNEITGGRISLEAFAGINHIGFFVTNFGYSVKGPKDDRLGGLLDSFWAEEGRSRKWTMGIWSGYIPNVKVDVRVFPEYLSGESSWPETAEWAVTHVITRLKNGKQQGQDIYYTGRYTPACKQYTMVSMVYDPMLQTYRMPCIHAGSTAECERLVEEVKLQVQHMSGMYGRIERIYFYRE